MKKNAASLTICIPTCYGGDSLVAAVLSLRKSFGHNVPILIVSDTTPLTVDVKVHLRYLGAEVIENKKSGSQIKKIKQMLDMIKTDYVIFTQDDITITENTANALHSFLQKRDLTMFTIRNAPAQPVSFIDYALVAGTDMAYYIEKNWNNGQNFLRGCGRFLGFQTDFMKKFRIPDGIVNVDAYFYFENKRLNGTFDRCEDAIMYYTLPNNLKEQVRKSSRYQYCFEEMKLHFSDIDADFFIPLNLKLKALLFSSITQPLQFISYVPLLIITRLIKEKKKETKSAMWKVDVSTK